VNIHDVIRKQDGVTNDRSRAIFVDFGNTVRKERQLQIDGLVDE